MYVAAIGFEKDPQFQRNHQVLDHRSTKASINRLSKLSKIDNPNIYHYTFMNTE